MPALPDKFRPSAVRIRPALLVGAVPGWGWEYGRYTGVASTRAECVAAAQRCTKESTDE